MTTMFQRLLACTALAACSLSFASDRASPAEATAMTKKAVAYLNANGKEKAFAEFNNPQGAFKDRDLYVMVYDKNGVNVAHGANPKLIGKNLIDLKDADGKPVVKALVDTAFGSAGKGWVDYKWPNPVTKTVEAKSTYVEPAGDVLIGVGVYK